MERWCNVGRLLALGAVLVLTQQCGHRVPVNGEPLLEDLKTIQGKRIFFGHQSVGANVLEGVREIVAANGGGPRIDDSLIGTNGDPESKCEDFARKLESRAANTDIALMKFCYIDFDRSTDVPKIFDRYAATIDSLQAKYMGIVFVPVTAPLTTRPAGWKLALKKALGRSDEATEINAKRIQFNRLLTERYAGRPIFDLAQVESRNGTHLLDEYSEDGGHLNEAGRRAAASALIHTLALAVRAGSAHI